ncbi:MAG TPA: alpha/beta hydrolase [Solirubrobacterales bacterium]|nr:alpha/beta hydrolase [Solirubrobacterales bacterium]
MAQTSSRSRRGKSSRKGRGLKITIGVLVVLLALIVLNAFALNNETESASLTTDGATLVETTSGELQVLDTGETANPDSMPMVLIHGSGGAINWWDDVIPILSQDHRVIAIDMLGYGGSSKPKEGYEVESQASLIAQVIAKLGVEKATVVGHSYGAMVATALAESSPELVAGVVVVDMGPDRSFGGLSGTANAAQWPLLGQALWRIAPDFMIKRNVAQGFAPGYDVPDKYVEDVRAMTYPAYTDSYSASKDYSGEEPLNDRLETTGVPLLVIFGEEDQIFDARESISAYAAIPGVQTLLIPDVGHSPQVEAPEETAAAIKRFADSLVPEPEPEPKPEPKPKKAEPKNSGNSKPKAQPNRKAQAEQGNKKQAGRKKQRQKQGAAN